MDEVDWDNLIESIDGQSEVNYVEKGEKSQTAIIHYYNGRIVMLRAEEF